MFIRLFVKTTEDEVVSESINGVLSHIKNENIKTIEIKKMPYWKYEDTTIAEIKVELNKRLYKYESEIILNGISNKWLMLSDDSATSSLGIDGVNLKYGLEMIDIQFE